MFSKLNSARGSKIAFLCFFVSTISLLCKLGFANLASTQVQVPTIQLTAKQDVSVVQNPAVGNRPLVVFIFDRSGSMVDSKNLYLQVQKEAHDDLIAIRKSGPFDLAIVPFASSPGKLDGAKRYPIDGDNQIKDALTAIQRALARTEFGGNTAVYKTFNGVFDELSKEFEIGAWSNVLVCLYSDGENSEGGNVQSVSTSLGKLNTTVGKSHVNLIIRPFTVGAENLAKSLNAAGAPIQVIKDVFPLPIPLPRTKVELTPNVLDLLPFNAQNLRQNIAVEGSQIGGAVIGNVEFRCVTPVLGVTFKSAQTGKLTWNIELSANQAIPNGAKVEVVAIVDGNTLTSELRIPAFELSPQPEAWGLPTDCGPFSKVVQANEPFSLSVNVPPSCKVSWKGAAIGEVNGPSVLFPNGVPTGDTSVMVTVIAPNNPNQTQEIKVSVIDVPNLRIEAPKVPVLAGDLFTCKLSEIPLSGIVEWLSDGKVVPNVNGVFEGRSLEQGTKRIGVRWKLSKCKSDFIAGPIFVDVVIQPGPAVRLLGGEFVKLGNVPTLISAVVEAPQPAQVGQVRFEFRDRAGVWTRLGDASLPKDWNGSTTVSIQIDDVKIPAIGTSIDVRATPSVRNAVGGWDFDPHRSVEQSYFIRKPDVTVSFESPTSGKKLEFGVPTIVKVNLAGDIDAVSNLELFLPNSEKPVIWNRVANPDFSHEFVPVFGLHGENLQFTVKALDLTNTILSSASIDARLALPEFYLVALLQPPDGGEPIEYKIGSDIPWRGKEPPSFSVYLKSIDGANTWQSSLTSSKWHVNGAAQIPKAGGLKDLSASIIATKDGRVDLDFSGEFVGFPSVVKNAHWNIVAQALEPDYSVLIDATDTSGSHDFYGESIATFVDKTNAPWQRRVVFLAGNLPDGEIQTVENEFGHFDIPLHAPTNHAAREVEVWADYYAHGSEQAVSGSHVKIFVFPGRNFLFIGLWIAIGLALTYGVYSLSFGNNFWGCDYEWFVTTADSLDGCGKQQIRWLCWNSGKARCSLWRKQAEIPLEDASTRSGETDWTSVIPATVTWSCYASDPTLYPENAAVRISSTSQPGASVSEVIYGPPQGARGDRLVLKISDSGRQSFYQGVLFVTCVTLIWGPLLVLLLIRQL